MLEDPGLLVLWFELPRIKRRDIGHCQVAKKFRRRKRRAEGGGTPLYVSQPVRSRSHCQEPRRSAVAHDIELTL